MRIIARCDQCQRQYDAAGKSPGKRFHCRCGGVVTVPRPEGHDASVVRCSGCGAPREAMSTACVHCGSDFTLHERDLHTVCPNCLARVSDRARYCHHCAHLLTSQPLSSATSEHGCPECGSGQMLANREISPELPHVLECSLCAGMWLGLDAIEQLIDLETRRGAGGRTVASADALTSEPFSQQNRAYRPCAACQQLMMRRNFGRGESNVIVDICRQHGVWFDANELAALLRWMRSGGLPAAQKELARMKGDRHVRHYDAKSGRGIRGRVDTDLFPNRGDSIADVAVASLFALFDL